MRTYHVVAVREGDAWSATVADADGAITWGKGLRHLEKYVREAIALAEDIEDEDSFELDWTFVTGDPDIDGESARLRARRRDAKQYADAVAAETASFVGVLRARNFSIRDAARIAGVSTARAGQIASAN
ncbi:MAG: hypothetical protein Q8P38_00745 [Candidatus Nanopelagicales bacterium]|nr:hypothetical protein [Candidatus Nanopelagicales bacterium]